MADSMTPPAPALGLAALADEPAQAFAAQRALLKRLGLPDDVERAAGTLLRGADAGTDAASVALPTAWQLLPDAAAGWLLVQGPPAAHAPRLWASIDRHGWLHTAAAWRDAPQGGGLREAWFRLPGGGWLQLQPRAGRHPLWGESDMLVRHPEQGPGRDTDGAGEPVGCLPALDYAAFAHLPPFDRPGALPPGGGGAVLNFLALLLALRGAAPVRYRGPYPTPALCEALCHSFAPQGGLAAARQAFAGDAFAAALRGGMSEHPVRWLAAPFAPVRVASRVTLRVRAGVERAFVDRVAFRSVPPPPQDAGAPSAPRVLPTGERIWREEATASAPAGYAVGLVGLGRPLCRLLHLAADGEVVRAARDEPAVDPPQALHALWPPVIVAWSTLRAHAGLAAEVRALAPTLAFAWQALPLSMAERAGGELRLQAALAEAYRQRCAAPDGSEDAAGLAMMLVSDALEALAPHLLALAQQRLESRPVQDPQRLLADGAAAQTAARAELEAALPALVRALAAGEALPSGGALPPAGENAG